ncbi:MAG: hypothetical protein ACKVGZ_10250 [Alphaproteobacteria bacterium]|jgi:hypothetical protein
MRAALIVLLPVALPIAVYLLWRYFKPNQAAPGWMAEVPWVSLLIIGIVLAGLTLVTWTLVSGAPPYTEYTSPQFKDGKIVPGGFKAGEGK